MTILQAIILGLVEGLTEFLPISSTFHLIYVSKLLGLQSTEFLKAFQVFIQAGAILPVVIYFGKDFFGSRTILKKVFIAFLPTAVVGLLFYKVVKQVFFSSDLLMIGVFLVVGFLLIVKDKPNKSEHSSSLALTIESMSYRSALMIGLIQSLAIVPGVSRSGAVILGMLWMKYSRVESTKFAFLLAVPTLLAAAALDAFKSREVFLMSDPQNLINLSVGFISAFLTALVVTKWFLEFVRTRDMRVFGWYRVVIGTVLIVGSLSELAWKFFAPT